MRPPVCAMHAHLNSQQYKNTKSYKWYTDEWICLNKQEKQNHNDKSAYPN